MFVDTKDMFKKAYEGNYAIGAFNVNNMEIVQGIMSACNEKRSPVILQISKGAREYANPLYLTRLMEEHNISRDDERCYFSQLYGMSDHISFNLANEGYMVAKYLPYGPVRSVLPYLIRRTEENTSIAGQTGRELKLVMAERIRRKELKKR